MKTKAPVPTAPKTRQITICNKGFNRVRTHFVLFPKLSLSGKWLQESGFRGGQIVNVTCEDRKLVITVVKEPE